MGALRKAGVWLGLVEDEEDRAYDDGGYDKGGYRESRYRQSRYRDEFADEDEDEAEEPPARRLRSGPGPADRPRGLPRRRPRRRRSGDDERSEHVEREHRSSVRSITRSAATENSGGAG